MPWKAQSVSDEILKHLQSQDRGNHEQSIGPPSVTLGPGRFYARLSDALAADMAIAGIDRESILTEASIRLTGGYGLTARHWDLVVLDDDLPVVVVEVKVLQSSISNLRNRIDDIVALATNVARTFDGPDRAPYKPCTAVLFIMEESLATTRRRATPMSSLSFPGAAAQPESSSYLELVGDSFSRMLADGLLDAVCFLTVDVQQAKVSEPFPDQSFDAFTASILTYTATAARERASGAMGAASLGRVLSRGDDVEEVVSGLTSTPEGLSAAEAAVVRERRRVVADLQRLALDPDINETKMHEVIGAQYWIFGGHYIGIADRRTIVTLDQYDIPLICADGSLEIVELKGPEVKLTRKYRNHLIVANEVHAAVNQCLNYLRALDEMGAALRTQFRNELDVDFDFRRARGTVIIGHPGRTPSAEATREQIDQTIRSYNAHLSRLAVITYADLLESAERALQFASEEKSKPQAPA